MQVTDKQNLSPQESAMLQQVAAALHSEHSVQPVWQEARQQLCY